MNTREIIPFKQTPQFELALPGSKSITNRALLCAALASGRSRIYGALDSDDTRVMIEALRSLGVRFRETSSFVEVFGTGGKLKSGVINLDLHNAGTATRFLTAIAAIRPGETIITGDERMKERPIGDLVDALRQMGVDIEYLGKNGCPPIRIKDSGLRIKQNDEFCIRMKGDKSSQYFSALLMLGPLLPKPLKIEVVGELVSKPYIDTTIKVLKAFGIKVQNNRYRSFTVKPQTYKPTDYYVEGDASAASYWASLAFLHHGKITFTNLDRSSIQGDIHYSKVLKKLRKGAIDMSAMPDSAMTLAVIAPFVKGKTVITGLKTLKLKETDRLVALENELRKVGVKVKTGKDFIVIDGTYTEGAIGQSRLRQTVIKTYNDHRMAMCFAVLGTKTPGVVIENPSCTDKTYPAFWEDLEKAYLTSIKLGKKNLVLTGMRGAGKTFLGKKIARLLKRKFVDLDLEIEKDQKMTISEIVKKNGWNHFRKTECRIVSKFADTENLIISTGGGVVLNPENMKVLKKNGVNLFIFADPTVLAERVQKTGNRPPLKTDDAISELQIIWNERRGLYLKYADYIWDNTSGKIIEENLKSLFGD